MFEGQRNGENIINVYHKHWIILLPKIFILLILFILYILTIKFNLNSFISLFVLILNLIYFLYLLKLLIPIKYTYYIITNQRIHYVNQKGLFKRAVMDIQYHEIKQIAIYNNDIIDNLLNLPIIEIELSNGKLIIKNVAHSEEMYNIVQEQLANK